MSNGNHRPPAGATTYSGPRFLVPSSVLVEARRFFRARGVERCEGTALLVGSPAGDGLVQITRLFIPDQVAQPEELGACVELTPEAHYTLPDNLNPGELFYARIHSHPGRAYHSATDESNAVLTHEGAISIVVPDFAAEPIDLERTAAVFRLTHGRGWGRMSPSEVRGTFTVTNEELHDAG